MGFSDFPWWVMGLMAIFVGFAIASTAPNMEIWGIVTMIGGGAIMLLWWAFRPKYLYNAEVFALRKGNYKRVTDKVGRFKHRDGKSFYFRFKKIKDTLHPAQFESLFASGTGKGDTAFFMSPAPGQYFPMTIDDINNKVKKKIWIQDSNFPDDKTKRVEVEVDFAKFDIIPENLKHWFIVQQQRDRLQYDDRGFWEKWQGLILLAITGLLLVMMIAAIFQGLNPYIKELTAATGSLARASETNAQVVDRLGQMFALVNGTIQANGTLPQPPDVGT